MFIIGKLSRGFGKLSFKKKLVVVVLVLAVLIVGYRLLSSAMKGPGYTTAVVAKSEVLEVVTETGKVISSGKVNIFSPTNGFIKDVYVKNGDNVAKGQKLFSVISSATEQEMKAAQANYLTAKASLDTAKSDFYALESAKFDVWDTFKQLAESDKYEDSQGRPKYESRSLPEFHIAEKDWLAAEARVKDQQVVIDKTQAQVSSTWLLYQVTLDATVRATVDGTISNMSVASGNNVSINSPLAPTSPVLLITTEATTEVIVPLGEADILKIKEDQEAKIEFDAIENKKYSGIVKRVDEVGTEVSGIIKYNVYIEVVDADNLVRTGMEADVEIVTNKVSDALTVPNTAVKPYEGGKAVRIPGKKKGDVEFVPVLIGIKGESQTQILEGVGEGQVVVVSRTSEEVKRQSPFGF